MKLMNKGPIHFENNKFAFETSDDATVRNLIDELHEEYGERDSRFLGTIPVI